MASIQGYLRAAMQKQAAAPKPGMAPEVGSARLKPTAPRAASGWGSRPVGSATSKGIARGHVSELRSGVGPKDWKDDLMDMPVDDPMAPLRPVPTANTDRLAGVLGAMASPARPAAPGVGGASQPNEPLPGSTMGYQPVATGVGSLATMFDSLNQPTANPAASNTGVSVGGIEPKDWREDFMSTDFLAPITPRVPGVGGAVAGAKPLGAALQGIGNAVPRRPIVPTVGRRAV